MGEEFVIVKGRKYCVKIRNNTLDLAELRTEEIYDISEDIEGLENLHGLRELIFDSGKIIEINGLENLTDLEYLDISYNQIKELKGLENLTNLKYLDLSENDITEIKFPGSYNPIPSIVVLHL